MGADGRVSKAGEPAVKAVRRVVDSLDAALLLRLAHDPRATVTALAQKLGIARNTAQARLEKLEAEVLRSSERRIAPVDLGYPITSYILADLNQKLLDEVGEALRGIPEVVEVQGISGAADLLITVAVKDAEDLYRVAGKVLAISGVERTRTSIAMKQMVEYRVTPLLERIRDRR